MITRSHAEQVQRVQRGCASRSSSSPSPASCRRRASPGRRAPAPTDAGSMMPTYSPGQPSRIGHHQQQRGASDRGTSSRRSSGPQGRAGRAPPRPGCRNTSVIVRPGRRVQHALPRVACGQPRRARAPHVCLERRDALARRREHDVARRSRGSPACRRRSRTPARSTAPVPRPSGCRCPGRARVGPSSDTPLRPVSRVNSSKTIRRVASGTSRGVARRPVDVRVPAARARPPFSQNRYGT